MKDAITLSIIIPTFNEAKNIAGLLHFLQKDSQGIVVEIIVADGHSTDDTLDVAVKAGAIALSSPAKGRAPQMNFGAAHAKASVLYFLHADSFPPQGYAAEILSEIKRGYSMGCFRLQFDTDHWFLKANAWFTRFNQDAFRFGDQSLFVLKDVFIKAGGFNENLAVMEDQEIIHRLKKYGKLKVMPRVITTSARKYRLNGVYKLQAIFFLIYFLYKAGVPQNNLINLYRSLIKQDKM